MAELKAEVGQADVNVKARVRHPKNTPWVDKAASKAAGVGKHGTVAASKFTAKGVDKTTRLAGRNIWGARLGLGTAALAIAAGGAAGRPHETKAAAEQFVNEPAKSTREAVPAVRDALTEAVDTAISRLESKEKVTASSEILVSAEEERTIDEVIDIFYPGTGEAEREELGNQIKITAEYMKGILTSQSYENLNSNMDLIENVSNYSGVPKEVFWGLCMAESRCGVDGHEPNSSKALGPVQITEMKGLDYGLNITNDDNDDRLKWDRALGVAAVDISQKTRFFSGEDQGYQNWGLGVWSWHKGQTGVKQEIESYSANHVQSYTNLERYVRENNITVKSILDIPNIRKRLEDPQNSYDTTTLFVLRVAGGALLVRNMEKLAESADAK